VAIDAGIPTDRIVIGGFSPGACLAAEFVARHPQRYAGFIALTGGLTGPPRSDLSHEGNLAGTPALFSSGDPDPQVPWQRVEQSARIFAEMGAAVTSQRYGYRPHMISGEEIDLARRLIQGSLRCEFQASVGPARPYVMPFHLFVQFVGEQSLPHWAFMILVEGLTSARSFCSPSATINCAVHFT
jgi:pimeloyl-ACP methyl ester carboxylesterase